LPFFPLTGAVTVGGGAGGAVVVTGQLMPLVRRAAPARASARTAASTGRAAMSVCSDRALARASLQAPASGGSHLLGPGGERGGHVGREPAGAVRPATRRPERHHQDQDPSTTHSG
jgi:hypothetical protein